MSDFKSYRGDNREGAPPGDGAAGADKYAQSNGNIGGEQQAINISATLARAVSGKSEGQINSTIIAQAEQGKRDGTLTNADLDNFYNTLAPLLDGFKKKKLQQVIAKLKAI